VLWRGRVAIEIRDASTQLTSCLEGKDGLGLMLHGSLHA